MPKQKLFDDESEEEVDLKTENEYAKKYDQWRGKEEMHKLEQKYGTKVLNSDASISSDSEDESDAPPDVSEEMEAQFLKTLALLKKKDSRIYDPGYKFFNEQEKESVKEAKKKTLTFADSDEDDDDDGNIFSIEKKAEVLEEEAKSQVGKDGKLKDFLTGKVDHIDDTAEKDLEPLKALWSDPKINEGEAFLRDYILNQQYLEDGAPGPAADRLRDDADLRADEALVEEQDKFERAYNFRFEEPDQEYLKRFPRTMNFIRPKDERRANKRAEVKSRKEDEKTKKMEEIARLKALKLQEIQQKIARIKEVTGNEELGFKDEDIEGDFDPAEHDRRMRAIFDEEFYGDADTEKPVFPDLDKELEIENWDAYEPDEEEKEAQDFGELHCEDAEFNMDADFDPKLPRSNLLDEMRRALGKKRRNRKNKSKLAKLLAADKPKYIPEEEEKTYSQYMEEYFKMDCEDVIGGDLPTRFKYREVVPNDYGLTVEEILLADDKELTQWVPLKKVVRHRPENVQKSEINTYALKAADKQLKKKILPSLFKNLPEEPELVISKEENKKKKKNRKKKLKQKATQEVKESDGQDEESTVNKQPDVSENSDQDGEVEIAPVPENEKVNKKKEKRKAIEVSQPSVDDSIELNASLEGDSVEIGKNLATDDGKYATKEKKKNKLVTIDEDRYHVETKADSSVEASGLSKRQKKNIKKKLKKKEKKNTKPDITSSKILAGKKRKLSENGQVPNKKHKNKNDSENKNTKHFNKDNNLNKTPYVGENEKKGPPNREGKTPNNEGDKNKNEPLDKGVNLTHDAIKDKIAPLNKEKVNNKNKPKNNDIRKNKDKLKNKNNDFKKKVKHIMDKNKNNDKAENPMNNLSDERLKAYGLNPKKYRGFLKYKKF